MNSNAVNITVKVNGEVYERSCQPRLSLPDFLRRESGLTGTHLGCEHGVCGVCTVLINGRSARSCCTFAVQVDGADVDTVEGLADDKLNELQEAFVRHLGLQCGFCTPGMLMTATELLRE